MKPYLFVQMRPLVQLERTARTADVAQRLGWSTVWTTDHVLVPNDAREDYGRIYDAILTLAWVGAKYPRIRLGTSVIVTLVR